MHSLARSGLNLACDCKERIRIRNEKEEEEEGEEEVEEESHSTGVLTGKELTRLRRLVYSNNNSNSSGAGEFAVKTETALLVVG